MSETNEKPRICDILGVEVGERFTIDGAETADGKAIIYRIKANGRFATEPSLARGSSYWFNDAINKPEIVKRVSDAGATKLTDTEKAILSVMSRIGAKWVSRDSIGMTVDSVYFWSERPTNVGFAKYLYSGHDGTGLIDASAMPNISEGMCVRIDKLITPELPY